MSIWIANLGIPFNRREPAVVTKYLDLINQGDTVFDIGAHIGYYTLLGYDRGASVHAFEPHPLTLQQLRRNISINDATESVTVVPKVVSDYAGASTLFEGVSDSRHSLVQGDVEQDEISVESVKLNEYCRTEECIPDLVKVDVEGGAAQVFSGASNIIDDASSVWIVELHNQAERQAFNNRFNENKYRVEKIGEGHQIAYPDQS